MIKDLLERPIEKRPTTLRFDGRILYLLDDTELVEAQLYEGRDIDELTDELKERLRDQISTDEITPAYICYFLRRDARRLPVPRPAARRTAPPVRRTIRSSATRSGTAASSAR